jgi:hypothetical protein
MKVLHLPANIASQNSLTVRALRDIGVDARGLVLSATPLVANTGIEVLRQPTTQDPVWPRKKRVLANWWAILRAIAWADVVHWHADQPVLPCDLALRWAAWLRKPRVVEFFGSEIRIPEIATADNPFLARLLADPQGGYHLSRAASRAAQARFARYGFACLVPAPELGDYVQPDLFPTHYNTETRVLLDDFSPAYPDPYARRPVVVHAPSKQAIKGTAYVLQAVEALKARCDFEFRLIHDLPHAEAMSLMRDCDIMLDQFVIGSFGVAALEAMAMGKPVICYLKPSVAAALPSDAPFINANPETLTETLGCLLADGERRAALGQRSRAYVAAHHDAHAVAHQLVDIYGRVTAQNRQGTL